MFLSRIFTALPPPAQAALFFLAQFAAALDRSRPPGKVLEGEAGPFLPSNGRSRFHSRLEGEKKKITPGASCCPVSYEPKKVFPTLALCTVYMICGIFFKIRTAEGP